MNTLSSRVNSVSKKPWQVAASEGPPGEEGFTLTELAVVVAVVAFSMLMLLSAVAHTQPQSRVIQCLNNLRQMQVGWRAYASDSADVMLPNGPLGLPSNRTWNGGGAENWFSAPANTDPTYYLGGLLAPYIGNQLGLYKCPSDTIPSDNGPRIRSYSMNGQMGNYYNKSSNPNPGYVAYVKVSDLVGSVPPSMGMVFLEESMWTLDDGYLQMWLTAAGWPGLPGSYHNGATGVSFADGHVELHQWLTTSLLTPVIAHRTTGGAAFPAGGSDPDWLWCKAHAAAGR